MEKSLWKGEFMGSSTWTHLKERRVEEMLTNSDIDKARRMNKEYGDDSFRRQGKFTEGQDVYIDDPRFTFSGSGVVVRAYVTINREFRNPYYRVLCDDGRVRSTVSYYLERL